MIHFKAWNRFITQVFLIVLVLISFHPHSVKTIYLPEGKRTTPRSAPPVAIGSWKLVKSDQVEPEGEVTNWWRCENCGGRFTTEKVACNKTSTLEPRALNHRADHSFFGGGGRNVWASGSRRAEEGGQIVVLGVRNALGRLCAREGTSGPGLLCGRGLHNANASHSLCQLTG